MQITTANISDRRAVEVVFIPLFQNTPVTQEKCFAWFDTDIKKRLVAFAKKEFRAEEGEIKSLWIGEKIERVVLLGLGEWAKWNERKLPHVSRRMVQYAKRERIQSFTTPLFIVQNTTPKETAKIHAVNALMAEFEYVKYKEVPKEGWPEIKKILTDHKESRKYNLNILWALMVFQAWARAYKVKL